MNGKKAVPVKVQFCYRYVADGKEEKRKYKVYLNGRQEQNLTCEMIPKYCGKVEIQMRKIVCYDALGILGILEGKNATCYPGFEDQLKGAKFKAVPVVTDGNITTSRGMGTSILLGLELVKLLKDEETSKKLAEAIMMP